LNTGIYSPTANTLSISTDGTERVRVSSAGAVGIGTTTLTGYSLNVSKNITGATSAFGIFQAGVVQSDLSVTAFGIYNALSTQATAFTLPTYIHYIAQQGTIGAGSSVTNQYGFYVNSTLTGATNNYGFWSNIASGSNRWNTLFTKGRG